MQIIYENECRYREEVGRNSQLKERINEYKNKQEITQNTAEYKSQKIDRIDFQREEEFQDKQDMESAVERILASLIVRGNGRRKIKEEVKEEYNS